MTLLNIVGFESGVITTAIETVSVVGANNSIQSTIKRTGNYALRNNPTTTGTSYVDIQKAVPSNQAIDLATCYYRFYFRPEVLPAANSEEFASILASSAYKLALRIKSTGVIQAYDTTATTQLGSDGTTVLSTGTWY